MMINTTVPRPMYMGVLPISVLRLDFGPPTP